MCAIAAVGLALGATPARACMSAEFESRAFTRLPPVRGPDTVVVKLRVVRAEDRAVEAELAEPFDRAPGIERVIVETDLGNSCARWGPREGDVYAVVESPRIVGGTLYFHAPQRRDPVHPAQRRRSQAELDSYIVDPQYRLDAK